MKSRVVVEGESSTPSVPAPVVIRNWSAGFRERLEDCDSVDVQQEMLVAEDILAYTMQSATEV